MLVLLIIFLITIPVVTHIDPGRAAEGNATSPTQTKPENIVIAVNRDGEHLLERSSGCPTPRRWSSG